MQTGSPGSAVSGWIVPILMFGNAATMGLSGLAIGKPQKRFYYLAAAVLAVNVVLTVTDEFGIFDLVTLVIDLVLLGILIATLRMFHARKT